jgi:hypothetical protein
MVMFSMSMYSVVVLVHVTAGTLLIGSSIAGSYARRAILATQSATVLLSLLDVFRRASQAALPLALSVLASGVFLGSFGWWAQSWFYVALGVWVVQAALGRTVVRPTANALASALPSGDLRIPPEADAIRRSSAWLAAGAVMRGNDVTLLYLMMGKPALGQSILFAVLSAVVCLTVQVAVERGRPVGSAGVRSAAA